MGASEDTVEEAEDGAGDDAAEDEVKLGGCDDAVDSSLCGGIAVGEVVKLADGIRGLAVGQAMKHCLRGLVKYERRTV